ncbi:hypothetical protein [Saccharothrix sp. Mg75]
MIPRDGFREAGSAGPDATEDGGGDIRDKSSAVFTGMKFAELSRPMTSP